MLLHREIKEVWFDLNTQFSPYKDFSYISVVYYNIFEELP